MWIVFIISLISSFLGTIWSKSLNREDFKLFLLSEIAINTLDILMLMAAVEIGLESVPGYIIGGTMGGALAYRTLKRRA